MLPANEPKLLPTQLAELLPSNRKSGQHVSAGAVVRWITRGVKTADGRTVRLEAMRVSGRYYSSAAALERFFAAQQADAAPAMPNARSPGKRQKASERAAKELEIAGI